MQVLILADRIGRELLPLTDSTCPALLPVAGKPVIEHTLDLLGEAGIKKATIIIGHHADLLRAHLEEGKRWGMQLDYWLTRGEEDPVSALAQLPALHAEKSILVLRGDLLYNLPLKDFLEAFHAQQQTPFFGLVADPRPVAIIASPENPTALAALHWANLVAEDSHPEFTPSQQTETGWLRTLDSLAGYHQANLDAIGERLPGLVIPGRQTALGLTQGRNSKVSPQSLKLGMAFVGQDSQISATAEFYGEVVVGDHVIIEEHARLTDTLILPHTYVGEWVELRNAIVRGNDLIRVDTNTHLHLSDTFLLADLQKVSMGHSLSPFIHKLAGLFLLVLSLPLWPWARFSARQNNPQQLLRSSLLRGNRIEFTEFGERRRAEFLLWEWASPRPILRALPRLLAVISGDIRLVGVEPVSHEQAEKRTQEWERLADQAPCGLLGPTQLHLPPNAPEEERLMSDAFYASQRDKAKNLNYLLEAFKALFSRKAWIDQTENT